ncbi:MAG: 16S rRNA (cytidine(1402)-2'-O)-methyltransferase [Actinobacteria bacterium]|nr:MAG: 16S rRNA (cytidine(1402)-2'-O)-methyltransferase [Actinomycetota bacterium]TMK67214.1 MAG: 16S rRNA (cytidine(1402)-2'-O)-methyltransferase [Actinomycetota bacterium]
MSGILYLVGTPIGNFGDMTDRARETLGTVAVVAAEDTRRTGRLLAHFGIEAKMVSLFQGNEDRRTQELLEELRSDHDVAVVSDAGMPGLSDPGYQLVRASVNEGIEVRVVPGPSAVLSGLVVSGLPTDRFVFEGFLPRRAGERRMRLRGLAHDRRTVVLFESPHRIATLLRDLLVELGDRRVAIARELTKLHEEVIRGRTSEVLAGLPDVELKGELVVVLEGSRRPEVLDEEELVGEARALVQAGMRKRDAASEVARKRGASANAIYKSLIEGDGSEGTSPIT